MILRRKLSFISGLICGLAFAPLYFFPGILMLSVLCAQIYKSSTIRQAVVFGYMFGFGFFLASLYWISFGVAVYIEEFWWALPFALFGLPAFIAIFIALAAAVSWKFRSSSLYHIIFCVIWVFIEWLISWIFTGLPWALLGYAFAISETLIQPASIFGVLGLSFAAVFIGSAFYNKELLVSRVSISIMILTLFTSYGYLRLEDNPTEYSNIKVRIVQPSIPQIAKWDSNAFWSNLNKQIEMSKKEGDPDLIIWSEAALTVPYYYRPVYNSLMSIFAKEEQILLSGGVNDNGLPGNDYEIYSSLIALDGTGELLFDYHKAHLVPFGEYMPLKNYLPMKKLTPGVIDYTPGNREVVYLKDLNLRIWPLVCYESIFFNEVKISNTDVDFMVNITNDSWYGRSSGPFQHLQISRIRAVENGLPLIRSGNNGISAIIDPVGRVTSSLGLDIVDILDGYIPYKLTLPTIFSDRGSLGLIIGVFSVLIMHFVCFFLHFFWKYK